MPQNSNNQPTNNIEKKLDNKVIQAEGEIHWETKSYAGVYNSL